jgi:gamma-glutamylcyclotransferase (GGCT)/AIG2-like uncharacterized protein YtfP
MSQNCGTQLPYFAYGSNLLRRRLGDRIKRIPPAQAACLRDFRLAFNKLGENGSLYANIIIAVGSEVWGAVYACTEDELRVLDKCEGVPTHYSREKVTVLLRNGDEQLAYAYVATPRQMTREGAPTDKYLGFIMAGAAEHELPSDYVESVRKLGAAKGAT